MVTPNMPRFLRHGDRVSIATKISNLSDSTVTGNATLEFFDPVTDDHGKHPVDKYFSPLLSRTQRIV